jgi:hypothetical protein
MGVWTKLIAINPGIRGTVPEKASSKTQAVAEVRIDTNPEMRLPANLSLGRDN